MTHSTKKIAPRPARKALFGLFALASLVGGCLDRPIAEQAPRTSNALAEKVRTAPVDKIDLLFMIDNSSSMGDKQKVLARAVPDLVGRLVNPVCVTAEGKPAGQPKKPADPCPAGTFREFTPVTDIHIGVITSSLGGHGGDSCTNASESDKAHLISRDTSGNSVVTYRTNSGFFAWDPGGKSDPPGDSVAQNGVDGLVERFARVVEGANQNGCGYEAPLEAWYRFLIDPRPYASVTPPAYEGAPASVNGVDGDLLAQRAAFLRPDSLVAIVNLSDENDCSVIDGALPSTVCDDPEFNDKGDPVGCLSEPVGWPAGYVEGNFDNTQIDAQGRVTGTPERANHEAVRRFNADQSEFRLHPGTAACASDPFSPLCKKDKTAALAPRDDIQNLRCWNQKQRFGVDSLYPTQRYVDGLSKTKIYDRDGFLVDNPLFDDLPYKQARAAGQPLKRAKIQRDPGQVIYASIVGVPWQDIARDSSDLTRGYKPAARGEGKAEDSVNWGMILGNPRAADPSARKPIDPLMIEDNQPRSGAHPVTGEPVGVSQKNSINSGEREPSDKDFDLQYACTFALPPGQERECPSDTSPLCDTVIDQQGAATRKQTRAKAFPGSRFLQVAKDFGQNAVVASICTPNLTDNTADDYGYRPAMVAIVDRLKTQLSDRCLPRKLATNHDGTTPCLVVDAQFPASSGASPGEIEACQRCDRPARKPIDPGLIDLLPEAAREHACLCEITQIQRPDNLKACRTNPDPQLTLPDSSEAGGWCYVDPATAPADQREAAAAIVQKCSVNEQHTVRYVNASTSGSTLFMTCLGDAAGN